MSANAEMNNLAIKFLNSIRSWVDKRIPERTKECLRTKIAIITKVNSDNTYDVILAGDYGTYLDLGEEKKIYDEYSELKNKEQSLNEEEKKRLAELSTIIQTQYNGELMTEDLYKEKVSRLTLNSLSVIKADTYSMDDYVVVGYVDNKLTNSFILCKNTKKGV
jgi:hypothetical protein